jgi:hypothetical protein
MVSPEVLTIALVHPCAVPERVSAPALTVQPAARALPAAFPLRLGRLGRLELLVPVALWAKMEDSPEYNQFQGSLTGIAKAVE